MKKKSNGLQATGTIWKGNEQLWIKGRLWEIRKTGRL